MIDRQVIVEFDGGELEIEITAQGAVLMSGPACKVFTGVLGELA